MATTEHNGLMVYKDENGNMRVLYPVTKADLVDGLDELFDAQTEATDTKLAGKSNTGHTHDDRYYTEAEVNALLENKADASAVGSAVKILCGSYVGTGLTGANNKWSLTCPGKLIAFRLYATTNANYTGSNATLNNKVGTTSHGYLIFTTHELNSLKDCNSDGYKDLMNETKLCGERLYVKMLDDSTISMYGTMTNAENIFNYANTKYFYMMFYE